MQNILVFEEKFRNIPHSVFLEGLGDGLKLHFMNISPKFVLKKKNEKSHSVFVEAC